MCTRSTTYPVPRHLASEAGRQFLLAGVVVTATLLASGGASAEKSVNRKSPAEVLDSWTAEQLAAAQPKWQRVPSSAATGRQAPSPLAGQPPQIKRVAGSPPKVVVEPDLTRRLLPAKRRTTQRGSAAVAPQAAAPGGALYTQTQVWPSDLVFSYPYRVTGKLFARDGTSGQGLTCTASAIAPRLVITAAHCLYDNQTGAWATDFLFVPAYHLGLAPYGAWTATSAFITPEWAAQTVLPHPADVGLLVMADQSLDGPLLRIGDVTGWYGYVLSDLISHRFHVDFLGYPGNLDQGEIMQRTGAQTAFTFPPNNASYGSDQQQGSSGGPYVIDLQTPALGSIGRFPAVVGVESTGDGQGKVDISLLDSSFLNILNAACLGAFGNC